MSNQYQMKKQAIRNPKPSLCSIVLLLFSLLPSMAFCQQNRKVERTTTFQQPIQTLVIKSSMNLILTTDTVSLVSVFGSKKEVASIRVKSKNGRLILRRSVFTSLKSKPFIVVSAPELKQLVVLDNAKVESCGLLQLTSLGVLINADATVRLRMEGHEVTTALKGNGSIHIEGYYKQSEISKDPFGWCHVQYHRVADAIVADPH